MASTASSTACKRFRKEKIPFSLCLRLRVSVLRTANGQKGLSRAARVARLVPSIYENQTSEIVRCPPGGRLRRLRRARGGRGHIHHPPLLSGLWRQNRHHRRGRQGGMGD